MFEDKTILITGGTGSFGKTFARMTLKSNSSQKLIIFSPPDEIFAMGDGQDH